MLTMERDDKDKSFTVEMSMLKLIFSPFPALTSGTLAVKWRIEKHITMIIRHKNLSSIASMTTNERVPKKNQSKRDQKLS